MKFDVSCGPAALPCPVELDLEITGRHLIHRFRTRHNAENASFGSVIRFDESSVSVILDDCPVLNACTMLCYQCHANAVSHIFSVVSNQEYFFGRTEDGYDFGVEPVALVFGNELDKCQFMPYHSVSYRGQPGLLEQFLIGFVALVVNVLQLLHRQGAWLEAVGVVHHWTGVFVPPMGSGDFRAAFEDRRC